MPIRQYILYNKAIENDFENSSNYLIKKAFVLENWKKSDLIEIINVYQNAINKDPQIDDFYKDKLGLLYVNNSNDSNGYKDKALSLYKVYKNNNPKNELWTQRINELTGNNSNNLDVSQNAWFDDKDDITKALNYANTCLKK